MIRLTHLPYLETKISLVNLVRLRNYLGSAASNATGHHIEIVKIIGNLPERLAKNNRLWLRSHATAHITQPINLLTSTQTRPECQSVAQF